MPPVYSLPIPIRRHASFKFGAALGKQMVSLPKYRPPSILSCYQGNRLLRASTNFMPIRTYSTNDQKEKKKYQSGAGYTNFIQYDEYGNKIPPAEILWYQRIVRFAIGVTGFLIVFTMVDWKAMSEDFEMVGKIRKKYFWFADVEAGGSKSVLAEEDGDKSGNFSSKKNQDKDVKGKRHKPSKRKSTVDGEAELTDREDDNDGKVKKAKQHIGFRDRKVIDYENRVRAFSTPDKIFRYFATYKTYTGDDKRNFEVFMTPDDFVRSISPGVKQPEGLGLDQFKVYDQEKMEAKMESGEYDRVDDASIFKKLGAHGLISFTDYIFLLTVLSTSPRHFELAFKMFDLDGSGTLDYAEFEEVDAIIRGQTQVGARHRDHGTTGSTIDRHVNSALAKYFFGPNLDQVLTFEKFLEFQKTLQEEILRMEFDRREPNEDGVISEVAFADMLLMHSGLPTKQMQRMRKRVKKIHMNDEESKGISFDEIRQFFHFLTHINDVDTALSFYHVAGASIDKETLVHVALCVAGVELSQHVIDVTFTLFDNDGDGELSNKEFVVVMKRRLMRGLERAKDTGFVRLISALNTCAWNSAIGYFQNR